MMAFLYAVPLALLFTTLSNEWNVAGFLLGYVIGLAIMVLSGTVPAGVNWARLPGQLFWLLVYIARLGRDILLSGLDVARLVLDPRLPIKPGEVVVSTQDASQNIVKTALSAHAITLTPGEMVRDFAQEDGETLMIVHTLDIDASRESIAREQQRRLTLLRRIMGEDVE